MRLTNPWTLLLFTFQVLELGLCNHNVLSSNHGSYPGMFEKKSGLNLRNETYQTKNIESINIQICLLFARLGCLLCIRPFCAIHASHFCIILVKVVSVLLIWW